MKKSFSTLYLLLFLPLFIWGQQCDLTLSGYILDQGTGIALPYSNVYLEGEGTGAITDSLGFFQLTDLCPGAYHIRFSHIGCAPQEEYIELKESTSIKMFLAHHSELLDEVVVHGDRANSAQVSSSINKESIAKESNKNLSDLLENITGVSTMKNGTGVSKPVIHGLFGNRVAILNNGVIQSGQQWGNDHAPEIDPFVADHISVVKGAGTLAYGGNSLGSIVLVEVDAVQEDPHLHGTANYIIQSNGWGHTLNTQLAKNDSWAAWQITGTLKLQGDARSPNYYLTNTGKKEGNLALQVEKQYSKRWKNSLYYSLFNTEIGVLRGSHIGNLTDLEQALDRSTPFFTKDTFSYQIAAPRQVVQHHLLKWESHYFIKENQLLRFKYGGQLNNRKEYDIRRGGRTNIPALSLNQYNHFFETVYNGSLGKGFLLKTGLQFNFTDNANDPNTGILPLVPDYKSTQISSFAIFQKEKKKLFYEWGARYDLKDLAVATFSNTLPREVERLDHRFHNYALSTGLKYTLSPTFKTTFNMGYLLRAPEVNELYSMGLHQGVSGIEEGRRDLSAERSLKVLLSTDWYVQKKFFIQALAYYQNIQDYIYLQPQNDFRLTIRGAFPVFIYEQTDASIYGADFLLSFAPQEAIKIIAKYAVVRGRDRSNNIPLINIPADNLSTSITYSLKDFKKFKKNTFSINGRYVFQQKKLLPEQDFTQVPAAYFLLGFSAATKLPFQQSSLQLSFSAENLLNHSYRDYLNRLRYFADEPGVNLVFRISYSF